MSSGSSRRRRRRRGWILGIVLGLVALYVAAYISVYATPSDSYDVHDVDAVFILGPPTDDRIAAAQHRRRPSRLARMFGFDSAENLALSRHS